MPTGYTGDLYDGKEVSFEQFVWKCARAFGALVHMRDESLDAAISLEIKPDSYFTEQIEIGRLKLATAASWTPEQADQEAEKHYQIELDYWHEAEARRLSLQERYQDMLGKVQTWQPPTPEHMGLKSFMIEQLTQSLEHDCGGYRLSPPEQVDGATFRRTTMEQLNDIIARLRESQRKNEETARSRTAWLQQLNSSVPLPIHPNR